MKFLFALLTFSLISSQALAFDHSHKVFDSLLQKNVHQGRVNYGGFNASTDFRTYIASLATAPEASFSKNQSLAFWINAYNALTIKLILDHKEKKSIKNIDAAWDKNLFTVAGKNLSLNNIEHGILRKRFLHPGLHAVLVCAAVSCPPLESRAFTAQTVGARLETATRRWVADKARNSLNVEKQTLEVSKLFSWYSADFSAFASDKKDINNIIRSFFSHYGNTPVGDEVKVSFKKYNWKLNGHW